MSRASLPKISFHVSLSKPILLAGGPRELVLAVSFVSIYLAFAVSVAFGIWWGLPAGMVIAFPGIKALRKLASYDQLIDVIFWRTQKYKPFYRARGRRIKPTSYPDWKK